MENKNTLIAVVLMLVVWVGFTLLFPPVPPTPVQPDSPSEQVSSASTPLEAAPSAVVVPAVPVQGEAPPLREIVIETELYRLAMTTSGARISSLSLKHFSEAPGGVDPHVLLKDASDPSWNLRTVGTGDLRLSADTLYHLDLEDDHLYLEGDEERKLLFSAILPGGAIVEKVYTFRADRYPIELLTRVRNSGSERLEGGLGVSLVQRLETEEKSRFEFEGAVTFAGDDIHQDKTQDIEKKPVLYGSDAVWSGFVDKYFLTAAIPRSGGDLRVQIERSGDFIQNTLFSPVFSLAPGGAADFALTAYFGPKDLDVLASVHPQLGEAIDFGFFSFLARPLLHVLKFFYTFLGNYGLSIILLTVIIKLLFWPLTQKSYASMKAMQKLQPQMQKLREKYKNDRERLNREVMEMYKTHRVNPLGGCLPMIVQIPVFFALYKVLMISIELRHAPFYFWIQDLSAKDPYYITPLVMGATMFIQQKMTPSTMDPMQAKIFMLMPVIFTFMFLNFPSGLVLYWLVNNILTIAQQYLINRKAA